MPFYHRLGNLPRKRHTAFQREGGGLYHEHLMGKEGFSGPASLLYHLHRPTAVISARHMAQAVIEEDPDRALRLRHFQLTEVRPTESPTLDRTPVLFNADCTISFVAPRATDPFFYRNGQGDEIVYVAEGQGVLESEFGELSFTTGDYVVVPRGIVHRYRLPEPAPGEAACRLLVVEGPGHVRPPKRNYNEFGQLEEHSPYCERDLRPPEKLVTHDKEGEFRVVVKQRDGYHDVLLEHHPLDVVGWDGFYYPFALSIHDFEPITGSLHQPPPVHQTFQSDGFVLCSFVPRMLDYHPQAIPVPYNHSNVDSDEVIFYANDQFTSRKGIEYGSLTLHPGGLPHGPHPGRVEDSIGKKRTEELAVMVDTFRPLHVAASVLTMEHPEYVRSWLTG